MKPKPYEVFHYKFPRSLVVERARFVAPKTEADRPLTGKIGEEDASDLEERFGRALDAKGLKYEFKAYITSAYTLPSNPYQVDFIVDDGLLHPTEVDGAFAHKTAEQKEQDARRDAELNDTLGRMGYLPIVRIEGRYLQDQAGADLKVNELFFAW